MKQLKISFIVFTAMSLFLEILYPLMMTLAAQLAFPGKANGSLVFADGRVVGFSPTNKKLIVRVEKQAETVRKGNGMTADAEVPADLVHSYASGLDPHISLEAARLQAPCVARAGSMDTPVITGLVEKCAEKQYFGLSRDSSVKILELNMVLDAMSAGR
jgi:K+-transporting ATPase ATPase C chain